MARQDLGIGGNLIRDELLLAEEFPQIEALLDLYGIGPYSALLIVAELGEVERFGDERRQPVVHQAG